MARKPIEIDRNKLRAAIRKLGNEYVFYMLDDAIDLLPLAKLHKIAKKYVDLKRLRPDTPPTTKASLLTDVKLFEKVSLAGEYYRSFEVNWRNSMLAVARRTATPHQRKALAELEAGRAPK